MGSMETDSSSHVNATNNLNSPPPQFSGEFDRLRSSAKRKADSAPAQIKAAKMPAIIKKNGKGEQVNVVLVPTANRFDALSENEDEVILSKDAPPKKLRIPPITIFNQDRKTIEHLIKDTNVTKFSLKLLRRAIHVYCESTADFKTIQSKLNEAKVNHYSHDLQEEKLYKVALKGLHRMEVGELAKELKDIGLDSADIRIINPRTRAPQMTSSTLLVSRAVLSSLTISSLIALSATPGSSGSHTSVAAT